MKFSALCTLAQFLLVLCTTHPAFSQDNSKAKAATTLSSEKLPAFKCGQEAFDSHVRKYLNPLQTIDQPETDVNMILKFTINPDGSVTDVDAVQIGGAMRKPKDSGKSGDSRKDLEAELSKGKKLLDAATAALQATSGKWLLPRQQKAAVTLALHITQLGNQVPTYELKPYTDPKANKVYKQAAQMPRFKGGQDGMMLAINKHIQVPEEARKEKLSARVITSFIVEKDGSISNLKLLDAKYKKMIGPGEELDYMDAASFNIQNKNILANLSEAAINAVRATSGSWEPGKENGKPVRVEMLLPFSFASSNPPRSTMETSTLSELTQPVNESKLDKAYSYVEDMPRYTKGEAALKDFISANLTYPATAKEGVAILSFIVEKDGQLSNFKVEKSLAPALDAEALRVLRLTRSDWQAGKQGGVPVRVKLMVPVRFELGDTK